MLMDNTSTIRLCEYCGNYHPGQVCWRIEQIEYHPNGNVKFLKLHQPQFLHLGEARGGVAGVSGSEASLPQLTELLKFIDGDRIEIKLFGNDGFDRQEVIDGRERMKAWILGAVKEALRQ
jgi:hypothetical protein